MDYDLLLFDRLNVIKDTINKYGEQNFYLSFSGGKDSTILHHLIDMALPNNRIPRVFINTGIEYNDIVKFVKELASKDDRFVILKPTKPIKQVLEKYGYPFKSKEHSLYVSVYQNKGTESKTIQRYLNPSEKRKSFGCPLNLNYQFEKDFTIKISNQCCYKLKKEPVKKWEKENNKSITITGMRRDEGGTRKSLDCIITKNGKAIKFHPLAVVDDDWENEFIKRNNIQLCKLYYPPFNFDRTGCKGCPFALKLQEQLDTMLMYLPNEKKQCEMIWKPIYEEYRKLGYRLRKDNGQMNIFEYEEKEKEND